MFFTDNKSIFNFVHKKSIDIPKYLISDIVYFNKLPYDTYLHNDEDIDIINEYNMYKFKIIEKFFINDKWGSILLPVDNIKIVFESPDDSIYAYDKNLIPYTPSYEPKNRKRLLESKYTSKIWYPYQFKTEYDMIKDYGEDWREKSINFPISWDDDIAEYSDMDKMLGTVFPFTEAELNLPYDENKRAYSRRYVYDGKSWTIGWWMLKRNTNYVPDYQPKNIKRTLETKNHKISESYSTYPYNSIVVIFNNFEELLEFKNYMPKVERFESIPTGLISNAKFEFDKGNKPLYFLFRIDNNILDFGGWSGTYYLDIHTRDCGYKYEKLFTLNDVKNGLFKQIEEYGYFMLKPSYEPKNRKRLLESKNNTLHVFDFDDTMFHSNNFEDSIKYLIEKLTPENILKKSINDININLKDLKYDNGRIYVDDIDQLINIPKNSEWIRKKDRIYLTQPESYYLTEEGKPDKPNNTIIELYNSVDNRAILTARKEKFKNIILDTLHRFNIEEPNIGIFMYPDKTNIQPSMWKAHKLLEIYKNGNYNEIHYYDSLLRHTHHSFCPLF